MRRGQGGSFLQLPAGWLEAAAGCAE